jgi:hypothetical protein
MRPYRQALIFTGHMVDAPDRPTPRFPAGMEPAARAAIGAAVKDAAETSGRSLVGIASGARGGDILFLESLKEEDLPFRMVLPFGPEAFLKTSVLGASGDWEKRFRSLWTALPPSDREDLELPVSDEAFAACNMRMLDLARSLGEQVSLLALWDGKDTQPEPGGTAHFIQAVRSIDGHITIIDVRDLAADRTAPN